MGLATTASDDPHGAALEMAKDIAGRSPHAIQAAKRLFRTVGAKDDAAAFADERTEIGQLIGSPNQVESVMAYFEKRDPNFADVPQQ